MGARGGYPAGESPRGRADVVAAWCAQMRRRGLSAGTIEARRRLLRRWWDHVDDVWSVDHLALEDWIDSLGMRAASSRYAVVSHLHAFYRWAMRAGITTNDPTLMVERPKLQQRLPRPIHPTDLALALFTGDAQMRAAIMLAATSGLRCCELARLRWDDVHDGEARVLGKGSKERVVPVHPMTIDVLEQLDRTSVFVFDGWQTRSLAHPGLRASQLLNRHMRSLGISATAHSLRHYAGSEALQASGGDLRAVQELLGHASPATTSLYTKLDVRRIRAAVDGIPVPTM